MDDIAERKSAASIGAHTAVGRASSSAGVPRDAGTTTGLPDLTEMAPSFAALFPSTRYFEIDSRIAGARFSAWVTLPAQYDADKTQRFPVVYQVDGNLFFPATAPFHGAGESDPMSPHIPFILVSLGYSERESHAWTWLRVRDLLPPGEAVPEVMRQALQYSVEAGLVSQDEGDRYLAMFARPAGDKFLGFIEDEFHPLLAGAFRVDGENVGLWGDSYGGLFAAYVAVKRSELFKCIGVASPGIIGDDSQIFQLYEQAAASERDYSGRRLHITLAARELTEPSIYRWLIASGTTELLARTYQRPLSGLRVSTEIMPLETHLTGGVPSWFSFLRACYGRSREGRLE